VVEISPLAMVALLFIIFRGDIRKDVEEVVQKNVEPLKKSIDDINNRLSKQEGIIEAILHLSKKRKR